MHFRSNVPDKSIKINVIDEEIIQYDTMCFLRNLRWEMWSEDLLIDALNNYSGYQIITIISHDLYKSYPCIYTGCL